MNTNFYNLLKANGIKPKSILHVGANRGQEAKLYNSLGIEGWHVEAIPTVYKNFLIATCKELQNQHAINACLSDKDGSVVKFKIASNDGLSSSLLDLGRHAAAYPNIRYLETIELETKTIDTLVAEGAIPNKIDFLLVDAQGAEALILDGASRFLESKSLLACQIETSVVALYDGGGTYIDICEKLLKFGFHLRHCTFNQMGWTDALFTRAWWPELIPKQGDWSVNTVEIMKPKSSPFPLIRIGGDNDGAYLIPDDLHGVKACFSPGVNNSKKFEDELFDKFGIISHMCDFSSDLEKFETPLKPGQTFKKKWLDVNDDKDSISLNNWVTELEPNGSGDLLLQMDIEGAEYRNLLNTPEKILKRFRIILIELHRLDLVNLREDFQKDLGPLLTLLNKDFICVHAHPNNCCGDVVLSGAKLNVPKVLELTFLRRDRWKGVKKNECHPPLLPHPLDISENVKDNPPLFLNEHWLDSGTRAPESIIKMLSDQVRYLTRALEKEKSAERSTQHSDLPLVLHRLAQHAAATIPSGESNPTELTDLAKGKNFSLSSTFSSRLGENVVKEQQPFFFHTNLGRNESITIDLEDEYNLFELQIINRSDGWKDRARCLFYCIHNSPVPNFLNGMPINICEDFFTSYENKCITKLGGIRTRYLTIFSPEETYLHLSSITILGLKIV